MGVTLSSPEVVHFVLKNRQVSLDSELCVVSPFDNNGFSGISRRNTGFAWRPDVVSFNTALAAVSSSNLGVESLRYLVLGLKRG